MDIYQQFISKSRYSRFLPDQHRREHCDETVDRYINFMEKHLKENYNHDIPNKAELSDAIKS